MLAVSLKDTAGVKYAEDFIKLSVAQSHHIFPTQVKYDFFFPVPRYFNLISAEMNITFFHSTKKISFPFFHFSFINLLQTIFSVGDIICFDSPLTYPANWISTDKAVIEVDNNSGK